MIEWGLRYLDIRAPRMNGKTKVVTLPLGEDKTRADAIQTAKDYERMTGNPAKAVSRQVSEWRE